MKTEQKELAEKKPEAPMPLIQVKGEGYITRKDTGEKVPFHFEGKL